MLADGACLRSGRTYAGTAYKGPRWYHCPWMADADVRDRLFPDRRDARGDARASTTGLLERGRLLSPFWGAWFATWFLRCGQGYSEIFHGRAVAPGHLSQKLRLRGLLIGPGRSTSPPLTGEDQLVPGVSEAASMKAAQLGLKVCAIARGLQPRLARLPQHVAHVPLSARHHLRNRQPAKVIKVGVGFRACGIPSVDRLSGDVFVWFF